METAALPAEGVGNLLRAQGEEQGQGSKLAQLAAPLNLTSLPPQNIPLMRRVSDSNLDSSPVFPRPRLLCPV